ncbi:MAG: hypothetical protein WCA22_21010 [Candidatus Binatus sp.]
MKIFGIILLVLGILACLFAITVGAQAAKGDYVGLGAIAIAIAAVGIVGAAAAIMRNS